MFVRRVFEVLCRACDSLKAIKILFDVEKLAFMCSIPFEFFENFDLCSVFMISVSFGGRVHICTLGKITLIEDE